MRKNQRKERLASRVRARARNINATCLSRVLQRACRMAVSRKTTRDTEKQDRGVADSTEAWSSPIAEVASRDRGCRRAYALLQKVPPKTLNLTSRAYATTLLNPRIRLFAFVRFTPFFLVSIFSVAVFKVTCIREFILSHVTRRKLVLVKQERSLQRKYSNVKVKRNLW